MRSIRFIRRKSVGFWIGMQACFQFILCAIFFLMRGPVWITWVIQLLAAFGTAYWQMRTNPLLGVRIILGQNAFEKWDLVQIAGTKERAIVFKKSTWPDGRMSIRLFPFTASRYRLKNAVKLFCIKVLVLIKCIK